MSHPGHDNIILGTLATGEGVPLTPEDRRRHVYVIGQTGTGKTAFMLNLMLSDTQAGRGICFLDPHGDAAVSLASNIPKARVSDTLYLDPTDATHVFCYNPITQVPALDRPTAAANVANAFKSIWAESWGPRLEFLLVNALRLLMDTKDQSLLGLPRLLNDEAYRKFLIRHCEDPVIREFWKTRYPAYDVRFRNEMISPIENKVGVLLANPYLRTILCQTRRSLDLRRLMNEERIVIVNLSKGGLGTEPSHLLGALLICGFAQAAEARRSIPEHARLDFTLYADEFQNFATDSFGTILSEARKWRLSLVAANQQLAQLPEGLRRAVFGNTGTIIAFRVGAQDTEAIAAELGHPTPGALRETKNYQAWIRLMHRGIPLQQKLLYTFPPVAPGRRFPKVEAHARARVLSNRANAERDIAEFLKRDFRTKGSKPGRRRSPD